MLHSLYISTRVRGGAAWAGDAAGYPEVDPDNLHGQALQLHPHAAAAYLRGNVAAPVMAQPYYKPPPPQITPDPVAAGMFFGIPVFIFSSTKYNLDQLCLSHVIIDMICRRRQLLLLRRNRQFNRVAHQRGTQLPPPSPPLPPPPLPPSKSQPPELPARSWQT